MSPLCLDTLKSLHDATGDVFIEILNIYFADARSNIDSMRLLALKNDNDQLLRLAHTLKGSSRNIGARDLADTCEIFEKLLRSGTPCDLNQQVTLINYESTLPYLHEYLAQ